MAGYIEQERSTVLIVDDVETNILVLYESLRDNHRAVFATSGHEALSLAESENPDLVLLDVMMPGMDGYEVCRRLKENPRTANIPVIFVTALNSDEDEARGLEMGAIDYITKPISPSIVRARVKNHITLKKYRDLLERLAESAQRLKKEFLSNLTHELRNPLHPILMYTEMIMEEETRTDKREFLSGIHHSAETLLTLVDNLIEITRLDAGTVPVSEVPISLPAFLESLVSELAPATSDKDFSVALEKRDPSLDGEFFTDPFILRKALVKIVENAVKFTQRGQVILGVRGDGPPRGDDRPVRFSVTDTGCGIPREKLAVLAGDLSQGDGSLSRSHGGLGTGLTLARKYLALLGGSIQIRSEEGKGSTFSVHLSLKTAGPARVEG